MSPSEPPPTPPKEGSVPAEVRTRIRAPLQPIVTPSTFLLVMGSLRMSAASSMAKIGIEVVTILALMGDVSDKPMV